MVLKEIDWEPDSMADRLDVVERYITAFKAWGFDVTASVSGSDREGAHLIVTGPRQGFCRSVVRGELRK